MLVLTLPMPFSSGAAPFAPTDIAGLQLWLKAETLDLNDGDPVGTWYDSGTYNHTASQATAAKKPIFRANGGPNSKDTVEFDGVDDNVKTGSFTLAAPVTIYIVVKQLLWTSLDRIVDG